MKPEVPPPPRPEEQTVRRRLLELLAGESLSAREISQALSIPEKEVAPHLEHLRRTLHPGEQRLEVTPALCRKCGFSFAKRERLRRPSKCPVCRSESIEAPRFAVLGPGSGPRDGP